MSHRSSSSSSQMEDPKFTRLGQDLEDTPTVPFSVMLEALIARNKESDPRSLAKSRKFNAKQRRAAYQEAKRFAEDEYRNYAKSAVDFCNGKSYQCKKLKTSIRQG